MSFDRALRELAERLDLPEPSRSRLLLELRTDLESLAAEFRSEGAGQEEARRRALETLLPSAAALAELRGVHRPVWDRWVARLSAPGRHRVERAAVATVAVVYLLGAVATLSRFDLLESPSPFLWPLLFLSVVLGTAAAVLLFRLLVRGARVRRASLRALPLLGGIVVITAFAGGVWDLYVLAGTVRSDISQQLPLVLAWLRRESVLFSVALVAASAAGLAWLLAATWIARIQQIEAAALHPFHSPRSRRNP